MATLAAARQLAQLSQRRVADKLGVRSERVSAMERYGVPVLGVRTLANYAAAIGGELHITISVGGETVCLDLEESNGQEQAAS